MKKTLFFAVSLLLCVLATTAWCEKSEELDSTGSEYKITYEKVDLPEEEDMGLLGMTFLFDTGNGFAVGPGVYGALTGDRGGFITLGLEGEFKKSLNTWVSIGGGLFLGAGGGGRGGYELSGSGLMIRPHAEIILGSDGSPQIGIGISHIEFPDGDISSTQPFVAFDLPFETLIEKGWSGISPDAERSVGRLSSTEREIEIVYGQYFVPSKVKTSSGTTSQDDFGIVGAQWHKFFHKNVFLSFATHGAIHGESNGYMQIFMGAGFRLPLSNRTNLKFSADVGVGGGGSVDTGGGFLVNGAVGIHQYLTDSLYIAAGGGYIDAPDGDFKAVTAFAHLGYRYAVPFVQEGSYRTAALSDYERRFFRIRLAHQTYLGNGDDWRIHHSDLDVDNLGFQLDYFPSKCFYLTGQGLAAYGRGKAGAYMTGLMGIGVRYPVMESNLFLDAEGLAGAAGGGGLAVGGGFVWQTNAGVGWNLTDNIDLTLTAGFIDAPKGDFEATVVGISLGYKFAMFVK